MNSIWYKAILLGLLLMFIIAPYAGFAPLLLVMVISSFYWFITSIMRIIVFGQEEESYEKEV